jgi:glycosyltransferase involved in cell wall biosynthesis
MNFSVFCSFDVDTASFRQMHGHSMGLAKLGHQVHLVVHPFKYHPERSSAHRQITDKLSHDIERVKISLVYSWVFRASLPWLGLFPYLFCSLPNILWKLLRSDFVIIYKPLPLSTFYAWILKRLLRKKGLVLLLDDWEGVGGFANTRSANSVIKKTLLTFCEEYTPALVDSIQSTSKVLHERMQLSKYSLGKSIYLSHGCQSLVLPDFPAHSPAIHVVYAGSYKSSYLVQFLASVVLATCSRTTNIHFTFIGAGKRLDLFKDLVSQFEPTIQSHVRLTGYISEEDKIACLSQAQIALLYLNDQYPETLIDLSRSSTKLFEYLSAGRVVIASDFGEPRQILAEGETGYLCNNDPIHFAEKIIAVSSSPEKMQAVSRQAKQLFETSFTYPILMGKLIPFLQR